MDHEYMLIIGLGVAGALLGVFALLVGAEILGMAGIGCGCLQFWQGWSGLYGMGSKATSGSSGRSTRIRNINLPLRGMFRLALTLNVRFA
jgi:hypothetical protein